METRAEKMMVYFLIIYLWSACGGESIQISQPASFRTVELEHTVTITCRSDSVVRTWVWCKLNAGRRLQLVSTTDVLYQLTTFKEQSHHYSVKSDNISSHLTISATTWEDVGTYYCGVINFNDIQFGQGTSLMIKGANMISASVVQQPEAQSVQPGDSVTLSCSVHTGHCAAEHTSVMWLKNSHLSAPQMIHFDENKNRMCQRNESGETKCLYNLLLRNLSSDDAGTYYCVVASCGQTLFGNGTRINIHRESLDLSPAVNALMLSNIVLGIVTLVLVWALCKNHKKDPTASTISNDGSIEGNQAGDAVIYAAVCSAPRSSSCRSASVKYSQDTVVYSDVRYC